MKDFWTTSLASGGVPAAASWTLCCTTTPGLLNAMLFCRASGEICNLSMTASMGPCVEHRQGSVRIDRCVLESVPETGLEHLCSPIVSRTGCRLSELGPLDGVDSIMARTHLYVDETVIRVSPGQNPLLTTQHSKQHLGDHCRSIHSSQLWPSLQASLGRDSC